MWSVLSASHPLHNISLYEVSEGVCGYTFTLELNSEPTTLAWIMRDSLQEATDAVLHLLANPVSHQDIKRLFWDGIHDKQWHYAYDSVLCLNKMASELGKEEGAVHWNQTVEMENLQLKLYNGWKSSCLV